MKFEDDFVRLNLACGPVNLKLPDAMDWRLARRLPGSSRGRRSDHDDASDSLFGNHKRAARRNDARRAGCGLPIRGRIMSGKRPKMKPDWRRIGDWNYDVGTPSGRILHSLAAMRLFEKTPGMCIGMSNFRSRTGKTCFACCGGASRCAIEGWTTRDTFRTCFQRDADEYEESLDNARNGHLDLMFQSMDLSFEVGSRFNSNVPCYHHRPRAFYSEMEQLAEDLRREGW